MREGREEGKCGVAIRDTSSSRAKPETTKKNTMEAVMTKTEKPKLDEGATSTLPPGAFAKFEATTKATGKRVAGLARAAENAQGLLKDAD